MNKLALTCVVACAGCASTGTDRVPSQAFLDERTTAFLAASTADKAAERKDGMTASATMTYWMGLKAALHPVPVDSKVAAQSIGKLPTLGVDPDLARESQFVAEKMLAAADSIGSMPAFTILFRLPTSRWAEAEGLSRAAIEQCNLVERMRPALTARYGVKFPPLDVPTP